MPIRLGRLFLIAFTMSILLISTAIYLHADSGPQITQTYDGQGRLLNTSIASTLDYKFKSPLELQSNESWPTWNVGFCPYVFKSRGTLINRSCLSCHNGDRTLRGPKGIDP